MNERVLSGAATQPTLVGAHALLRPGSPDELRGLADAIAADPQTSPWWTGDAETILGWLTDEEVVVFVIESAGEMVGLIQYSEEPDPHYRHASIDISLLSPAIGQGLGGDSLRTLCRYLFEGRGHHRITIDPAVSNERAIAVYERVGFKRVGVMRAYERDSTGWHDGLLMDMLPDDLVWGSGRT